MGLACDGHVQGGREHDYSTAPSEGQGPSGNGPPSLHEKLLYVQGKWGRKVDKN